MQEDKKPIIKVWFAKPREAWYQLSEKEQKDFFEKEHKIAKELCDRYGIKNIKTCNCRWSNEEWLEFGMEEFPTLEAVQEYNNALSELGMYKYFNAKVFLGTPMD